MNSKISTVILLISISLFLTSLTGCFENKALNNQGHFDTDGLDGVLSIVIDMSGSFSQRWENQAYPLFLNLSERFFTESMGTNCKITIAQLSGNDQIMLFEGTPISFRQRFKSPQELNAYLLEKSDPVGSKVYAATKKSLDHTINMAGVTNRTKLLTVILSDMIESEQDQPTRDELVKQMKESLRRYQALGGGIALYYVSQEEMATWNRILQDTGYQPGYFIIENELSASPLLPKFD